MALKLCNKSWYPFIFLIGSAVVIVLRIYFPSELGTDFLLSGIGIVAGFTYFLYKQHLDETKLFKEMFIEFNARYDGMKKELNKISSGSNEAAFSPDEQELLFSYFNLCAEEFFFYELGYIDCKVWKSWSTGMNGFFKNSRVLELWKKEESDSYYGFSPDLTK